MAGMTKSTSEEDEGRSSQVRSAPRNIDSNISSCRQGSSLKSNPICTMTGISLL